MRDQRDASKSEHFDGDVARYTSSHGASATGLMITVGGVKLHFHSSAVVHCQSYTAVRVDLDPRREIHFENSRYDTESSQATRYKHIFLIKS